VNWTSHGKWLLLASCFAGAIGLVASASAMSTDLVGPAGSSSFGAAVKVLPNGNIVVSAPDLSWSGSFSAVYLYSPSGTLISTTRGNSADLIGSGGIQIVGDGNFVICSPKWMQVGAGPNSGMGAATWVNGMTGLDAEVSSSNSLVGTGDSRSICDGGVTVLKNGNYVVRSVNAQAGDFSGAVTWCSGNSGCTGAVSAANSLVGRHGIGYGRVVPLSDGDYAVASPFWRDDAFALLGAVTRCSGTGGCTGFISTTNSLVGSTDVDVIGSESSGDAYAGVMALANGGFIVRSSSWHNGVGVRVGAVTFVPATGLTGAVRADNSLVGTTVGDFDESTITTLANGNYVVDNPAWDRAGLVDAGASTFCSGTSGCIGPVSTGNSLVGTSANDWIGYHPTVALTNGNYVVDTRWYGPGGTQGSVIWCNGTTGCTGEPSLANSLVWAGGTGVTALANGNYVVATGEWSTPTASSLGAVTWCDGAIGCVGEVSASNSLIGATEGDSVGATFALANGNYAVESNQWQLGGVVTGAVTLGDGRRGLVGVVSSDNSFVGTTSESYVPGPHLFPLANGDVVVWSKTRSNGGLQTAGAVTLLRGHGMQVGSIDATNSVIGNAAGQGPSLSFDYDVERDTLVVGKPTENIVTLLRIDRVFSDAFD